MNDANTQSPQAQPLIDGSTKLYGIIGHPIEQVKSPLVFNPRFKAAGLNGVLVPLDVLPEAFETTVRGLMALANLGGLIVTVPYKVRAMALVDEILPTGRTVGAINAMRRRPGGGWAGDMFDGRGLVAGLAAEGLSVAGRRVLLIGTGGAGSAVATGRPIAAGHDVIVNATPIGMAADDGLPAAIGRLEPAQLVIDVIAKPEVTPLLAAAKASGCRTIGGKTMLAGQTAELEKFLGIGG